MQRGIITLKRGERDSTSEIITETTEDNHLNSIKDSPNNSEEGGSGRRRFGGKLKLKRQTSSEYKLTNYTVEKGES